MWAAVNGTYLYIYRVAQKNGNGCSHSHSDFKKNFIWNLILYFKWTKMSMLFYISIHKDLKSHIMKKHKGTKLTLQSWFHIIKGRNWAFHFTFKIKKVSKVVLYCIVSCCIVLYCIVLCHVTNSYKCLLLHLERDFLPWSVLQCYLLFKATVPDTKVFRIVDISHY